MTSFLIINSVSKGLNLEMEKQFILQELGTFSNENHNAWMAGLDICTTLITL